MLFVQPLCIERGELEEKWKWFSHGCCGCPLLKAHPIWDSHTYKKQLCIGSSQVSYSASLGTKNYCLLDDVVWLSLIQQDIINRVK